MKHALASLLKAIAGIAASGGHDEKRDDRDRGTNGGAHVASNGSILGYFTLLQE